VTAQTHYKESCFLVLNVSSNIKRVIHVYKKNKKTIINKVIKWINYVILFVF